MRRFTRTVGTMASGTQPAAARRILIMRLGAIGDCLRVLPAVARLRRERPDAHIAWAVEHWVQPVLAGNPLVDRFHVLDRRELKAGPARMLRELRRFGAELREGRYEVVLDFHGRFKSGLLTWMSQAPWRIGYAAQDATEGNHWFTNRHVALDDHWENRVLRFLHLLEPLGIPTDYDPAAHGIHVDPVLRQRAHAWYLQDGQPPLAVYPGTSAKRERERWPEAKWVELLRRLADQGIRSVIFWGPAEAELCQRIADAVGPGTELAPNTRLPEMMAMLAEFHAFIGSDTAAMHMAWMQGVPTALFLGPKPVRTVAPLPPVPSRVLRDESHYVEGLRPSRQSDAIVHAVTVDAALRAVLDLLSTS